MRQACASLIVLALASTPAFSSSWTVDPSKSTLGFNGQQTGQPFSGTFRTWTARIDYDPARPEAAHILATVEAASAATGDPQRDEALPGADWFDAAQFPIATFEATGFTPQGADTFVTSGTLTIRGISKPVALPFRLTLDGDSARVVGKADLVRTTFGVGQGSWANDDYVALAVAVTVDLLAHRQP